jgi:hypothetical protein
MADLMLSLAHFPSPFLPSLRGRQPGIQWAALLILSCSALFAAEALIGCLIARAFKLHGEARRRRLNYTGARTFPRCITAAQGFAPSA